MQRVSCQSGCNVTTGFFSEVGFDSITRVGVGEYCVKLEDDKDDLPLNPVATVNWAGTASPEGEATVLVRMSLVAGCQAGADFMIHAYRHVGGAAPTPSDTVGWTMIVP